MLLFVVLSWTVETWTQYGGDNWHSHHQALRGAMTAEPIVKWSCVADHMVESYGPGIADLDGDGHAEVIFGSCAGTIYCLDGASGSLLWSYKTGSDAITAALAMDFDGNGESEVVMGSFDGGAYCFSASGAVKWRFETYGQIWSSPAALDVSGDGNPEVFVGSRSDTLYCVDGPTGTRRWASPVGADIGPSAPAIGDVNLDGIPEVLLGCEDGKLYCFDAFNGSLTWSYQTGGGIWSSPCILVHDGAKRILFGSNDGYFYCLSGYGSLIWRYHLGGYTNSSPSYADLDGDGSVEVLIGNSDGFLFCFGVDGSLKWRFPINCDVHRGPAIADLDGDGFLEVLSSAHHHDTLNCIRHDGNLAWRKVMGYDVHDITIGDVDGDACAEIVFGTQSPTTLWVLDDPAGTEGCGAEAPENPGATDIPSIMGFPGGFRVLVPYGSFLEVRLYDPTGRLNSLVFSGYLEQGTHEFRPKVAKGVWLPVIRGEGFCISGRFIVR
ncbi:MAG: PQQ-binding-like beta-propeller repeat protein [candidate division WOR-3 bacterium]